MLWEGGIDVRNNTTRTILLRDLFDYLRQPMLEFLPLISLHVVPFGGNGIGAYLWLQAMYIIPQKSVVHVGEIVFTRSGQDGAC